MHEQNGFEFPEDQMLAAMGEMTYISAILT
jgi:hypothetical protein